MDIFIVPILLGVMLFIYMMLFIVALFISMMNIKNNYYYNDFEEDGRTYVELPNGEIRLD